MMHLTRKNILRTLWCNQEQRIIKPAVFNIKYTLRTEMVDGATTEDMSLWQNLSFQTINHFLEEQMFNSIIYDMKGKDMLERYLVEYDNNFVFLPTANEACLTTSLHAKLNSICHEHSIVENIELQDTLDDLSYNYYNDELVYPTLPAMEDWLGELSFWETPWWFRQDFSTFDNFAFDHDELDAWKVDVEQQEVAGLMGLAFQELQQELTKELSGVTHPIDDSKKQGEILTPDFSVKKPSLKLVPKDTE
jgi:hypothetical protein